MAALGPCISRASPCQETQSRKPCGGCRDDERAPPRDPAAGCRKAVSKAISNWFHSFGIYR